MIFYHYIAVVLYFCKNKKSIYWKIKKATKQLSREPFLINITVSLARGIIFTCPHFSIASFQDFLASLRGGDTMTLDDIFGITWLNGRRACYTPCLNQPTHQGFDTATKGDSSNHLHCENQSGSCEGPKGSACSFSFYYCFKWLNFLYR